MPERYKKYEEEPWKTLNLRKMPVENYNVFYHVDNELEQVTVLRILYNKRDEAEHLRRLDDLNKDIFSADKRGYVVQEELKEYLL